LSDCGLGEKGGRLLASERAVENGDRVGKEKRGQAVTSPKRLSCDVAKTIQYVQPAVRVSEKSGQDLVARWLSADKLIISLNLPCRGLNAHGLNFNGKTIACAESE